MPRKPQRGDDRDLQWGQGYVVPRQRADGSTAFLARWRELDTDGIAQLRTRTFDTQDLAEDHLRDIHRKRRDGRYRPRVDITVREAIEDWLERGSGRWKPSTQATYRQRAQTMILPTLGDVRLDRLDTPRVQHWIDQLRRSGVSPQTIESAAQVLTGTCNEAARLGLIPFNPVAGTRRPANPRKEIPTWSAAEVGRVYAVLDKPLWAAVYRLALSTGMRPGELRALRWSDVDLDAGRVTIRRTVTKDADGHVAIGATTKTGRSRAVAVPASVVAALRAWATEQKRQRLASPTWQDLGLVFTGRHGNLLSEHRWQDRHDRTIAAAGVQTITLHQMRHTAATVMMREGVHPKIVSEILGHRSVQITLDLYTHVAMDLQHAAVDVLDAAFQRPVTSRDDDASAG